MAHDVLHMVCLGTHPFGSCRIIVPVYKTNLEFTPWSSKWQFVTLLSGCLKPSPCPLPIYTRVRFLFSQDQKKNFLPLLYGCLRPFLLPSSNHNTLEFVFNVLMKILKDSKNFCPCFSSMITLPLPSTKSSFALRSPTKHPVGA